MANTSDGEIIDWSPKGDSLDKNNNLDLPILLNNTLYSMNKIVNSSIYWHGGSFSPPLLNCLICLYIQNCGKYQLPSNPLQQGGAI